SATLRQPTLAAAPSPAPGEALGLGRAMSLDEARRRVGFAILLPTQGSLGAPDAVFFVDFPPGGQVSLVYRARPGLPDAGKGGIGLLLTEFRGDLEQPLLSKTVGPDSRVVATTVNGGQGFWIDGAPHEFLFRDR